MVAISPNPPHIHDTAAARPGSPAQAAASLRFILYDIIPDARCGQSTDRSRRLPSLSTYPI